MAHKILSQLREQLEQRKRIAPSRRHAHKRFEQMQAIAPARPGPRSAPHREGRDVFPPDHSGLLPFSICPKKRVAGVGAALGETPEIRVQPDDRGFPSVQPRPPQVQQSESPADHFDRMARRSRFGENVGLEE
jgi:hypothetical protein